MFTKTRVILTLWYTGILAIILIIFSVAIYTAQSRDFARIVVQRDFGNKIPKVISPKERFILVAQLRELRQSTRNSLVVIDLVIILLGGGLSFFLATKTLQPIHQMIDQQKSFLANASHELRTPLAVLTTTTEIALRRKNTSTKEYHHILSTIHSETNRLTTLVNNFLTLSQFDSHVQLSFTDINMSEIMTKIIDSFIPLAKNQHIALISYIEPLVIIEGNADAIHQLGMIFLDNAIKYTKEKGSITLTVKKDPKPTLIISDTGIGMTTEEQKHLFQRFYRADTARSTKGTGLGLSIAHEIIQAHHATISVKSDKGKGTTFTIKF